MGQGRIHPCFRKVVPPALNKVVVCLHETIAAYNANEQFLSTLYFFPFGLVRILDYSFRGNGLSQLSSVWFQNWILQ